MTKRGSSVDLSSVSGDAGYKCTIKYIDDADLGEYHFQKSDFGSKLIDDVCSRLNIVEKDYFGLRYVDKSGQRHWINPIKALPKQLSACDTPYLLCFRVKYYPPDLSLVQEEITRYQLFLQVKRDLQHGRLLSSRSEAALLCAYIIQATLGAYNDREFTKGYAKDMKLAAAYRDAEFCSLVEEYHQVKMDDVTTTDAERSFLLFASTLQTYGVDPYPCKSDQGTPLHFSFTSKGLCVFEKNKLSKLYPWINVVRMTVDGANLKVVAQERGIVKEYKTIFNFGTEANAKHVWRSAVEHMVFFTQQRNKAPKKIRSSRSLFRKSATVQFHGQTVEQLKSTSLTRKPPAFERVPSIRERNRILELSLDRSMRPPHDLKSTPSDRGYDTQSHPDDTPDDMTPSPAPHKSKDKHLDERVKPSFTLPVKSNTTQPKKQGIDSLPIDPNTGNWKSQSVMELNSSVNNHSAAILANNQSIDDLKNADNNGMKEDWEQARKISEQHQMSLPLARSESLNRPAFNTRDSTLDITESFQQSHNHMSNNQVFRVISRDTFSKSSSSDDLPSAGELKETIHKYTNNRWSLDYEPELDSLSNQDRDDENTKQHGSTNLLAVPTQNFGNHHDGDQLSLAIPKGTGNGKVYDTLYNPPQQAAPRKVPPVKPNSLRSDPIGMEDEIKLGNSRNHHLMSSQLDSPTNHQRSPNASPHLTEKDIEPAGLQPKLKPSKEEINERVTRSLQGPKSIIYEAYFIFGVLCGIICLTVLIAETDKPRTSGKSRLIGPLPQAESEMDEVVRLTNTWASWLRDTRLFGAFHEAIYGPIKERLVYYFSWLFQI